MVTGINEQFWLLFEMLFVSLCKLLQESSEHLAGDQQGNNIYVRNDGVLNCTVSILSFPILI